jgi:CubicO group peptidase (beta-lactamase class C family)
VSDPLSAVSGWPAVATVAAAGVAGVAPAGAGVAPAGAGVLASTGPDQTRFPWASVTKVLTALAVWVAIEEGTVGWGDPVGPPGATLAHLLAHASGMGPDSDALLAPPGTRRIYSNQAFEVAARYLAGRAGMPFERYLSEGVLQPLGLTGTALAGSPAAGASGPLVDLIALGQELLVPTLVSPATLRQASSVAFPGLAGVLPGYGRYDPNDWGLGVEIRGDKQPHWTGAQNSPGTFGHFGRSGSFLWVDPTQRLALASLADRPFGPWAARAWPALSDAVLAAYGGA